MRGVYVTDVLGRQHCFHEDELPRTHSLAVVVGMTVAASVALIDMSLSSLAPRSEKRGRWQRWSHQLLLTH